MIAHDFATEWLQRGFNSLIVAYFAHEVGSDVPFLVMEDRRKTSMRATENVLDGETFVTHASRCNQRRWPAIAEVESITKITFV